MTKFKPVLAALAVTGALMAPVSGLQAAESKIPSISDVAKSAYPGESFSQYYGGRRYYGGGYRRGYGGGVAAGIAGLAAGALVAGAIASQPAYAGPGQPVGNIYGHDPNWVSYCASRYRSFDPASGAFLANDGNRYYCE